MRSQSRITELALLLVILSAGMLTSIPAAALDVTITISGNNTCTQSTEPVVINEKDSVKWIVTAGTSIEIHFPNTHLPLTPGTPFSQGSKWVRDFSGTSSVTSPSSRLTDQEVKPYTFYYDSISVGGTPCNNAKSLAVQVR